MRRFVRITSLLAVVGLFAACSDDDPAGQTGTLDLTFEGDATFQAPHGTQAIYVAVLRSADGVVVARDDAVVSAAADPSFSFTFPNLLAEGTAYRIHYWIDSNFGGGTEGVCDADIDIDHQWDIAVAAATADVTVSETHLPANRMLVCGTFAADLTFVGDGSFNAPHGDQPIEVAIVRASDDLIVGGPVSGTVSATMDPAFEFAFSGALVIGFAYEIHYWIDSNFGDGTVGVCDEVDDDHQWSRPVATVTGDVTFNDSHDAAAQSSVCATFQ